MAIVQIRRGTTTQWAQSTVILKVGELGIDRTLNKLKIGNGTSLWGALPFIVGDAGAASTVPGPTGPQGQQGPKGDTGDAGASSTVAGPTGPQGLQGLQGATGVAVNLQGSVALIASLPITGNAINNAYIVDEDGDLYVWNGSSWYSAGQIVGPQGPTGATGLQGLQGIKGDTGAASTVAGPQGIQGSQGLQGAAGNEGPQGPTGLAGPDGPQGLQGLQGATGATGAASTVAGPTGPTGPKGDTGTQGAQGVKGDTGLTGAQGIQGLQGLQGTTGATGATGAVGTEPSVDYYITNDGSGGYLVNGVLNGPINFIKGKKHKIVVNASGHPFWIQTVPGGYSSANVYATGITNAGTANGSIVIELPQNAPNNLYYACEYHSSMRGSIAVTSENVSTPRIVTGSEYTLELPDVTRTIVTTAASGDVTITVPTNSSVNFPLGSTITLFQSAAGRIIVTPANGVTLKSFGDFSTFKNRFSFSFITLYQYAANSWAISGDLTT